LLPARAQNQRWAGVSGRTRTVPRRWKQQGALLLRVEPRFKKAGAARWLYRYAVIYAINIMTYDV